MNISTVELQKTMDVAGAFYDAAMGASPWRDAMDSLELIFPLAGTILEHHDIESGNLLAFEATNLPSAALGEWAEYYHAICPRIAFVKAKPAGTIGFDHRVLEPRQIDKHPLYQDFLHPNGTAFFLSTTLEHNSQRYTTLAMQRTAEQGHASDRDIELLQLLTKPLQNAFRLKKQLQLERQKARSYEAVFHELSVGLLIVDPRGRVQFVNQCADRIARAGQLLCLKRGEPTFLDRGANDMLQSALKSAAMGTSAVQRDYICLTPSVEQLLPVRIDILQVPQTAQFLNGVVAQQTGRDSLLIVISDPTRMREPPEKLLRAFFGLTRKEAALALAIARGCSLRQYSDQQGVEITTTRTHLAHLRAKLGARNQGDVIRIVSQIAHSILDGTTL